MKIKDTFQINKTENSLLADLSYKYVHQANSQQKQAGEAILILDTVDLVQ